MIRRVIFALALVLTPMAAQAQETPIFDDYEDMRAQLNELMKAREIVKLMNRFGGSDGMDDTDMAALEARIKAIFPIDFKHVDLMRVDEMQNGWSQEMYAFRTGLNYVFVTVLLHQREDSLVALNIKFNTDFYKLIDSF